MNPNLIQTTGQRTWHPALLAALAGLIVFSLLIDPSIIDPFNVNWLAKGDPAQSYLGWLFFRHEPWSLPLGLAHRLGMEQASSIVYSDSIPLLAIPLKLFGASLPVGFQYQGLWLCACYALQGFFACRLLLLFSARRSVIVCGVLLFLLSPLMLLRAQSHFALSAHWIIVAAIYLYYAPPMRRRWLHWLALLWVAPLVHAYLMFMAYAIWSAWLLRHLMFDRPRNFLMLSAVAGVTLAGSLAVMWLAGYFLDMDVSAGGFGYYSMNLLAPLSPLGAGPFLMGSPAAATGGQYEGFNYLGLGVVLALGFATVRALWLWKSRARRTVVSNSIRAEWPLLLCGLALTLLALSNVVTFGSHMLFVIPLSAKLEVALNVFRASGRLFWPVYYLLLLAVLRVAAGLSAPLCVRFLFVVLALQVADLWPFFHAIRQGSELAVHQNRFSAFNSPFWKIARGHYRNLYVIPGDYRDDSNIGYESLAGAYGFAIDSAYYARMPSVEHRQPRVRRHALFFAGQLDEQGMYLIQPEAMDHFNAIQRLLPVDTGVGRVDGFTVVAPGWFARADSPHGYLERPQPSDFPLIEPGREYQLGEDDHGKLYAVAGWSAPGDHAVWSEGTTSVLAFRVPANSGDLQLVLRLMPYLPAKFPTLTVGVRVNGQPSAHWSFEIGKPEPATIVSIPVAMIQSNSGNIAVQFNFNQPRSPLHSGESADPRELALLLQGMRLQPR